MKISNYRGVGRQDNKGSRGKLLGGDGRLLYLDNGCSSTGVHMCRSHGSVHLMVHLKCVCFSVCKFYLREVGFSKALLLHNGG